MYVEQFMYVFGPFLLDTLWRNLKMASGIYGRFGADAVRNDTDLVSDTTKMALYDGSHAFAVGDLLYTATNEISGDGYTVGGQTMTGSTLTISGATTTWGAADIEWTGTFTANHAVVYSATNADALIVSYDFSGAQAVAGQTFRVKFTNGLINIR